MATMRAFGINKYGNPEDVIEEVSTSKPVPVGQDILVKILAAATNPVDFKVIRGSKGGAIEKPPRITGYDGAGIVEAIGPDVKNFKVGDHVYFAGLISRNGTLADYTIVDERIVALKPKSLNWEQAACVPLVAITAWEAFFDEMALHTPTNADEEKHNSSKVLLIVGGAGGVGSIAIQIAKKVLKLTVVATATRPDTIEHCKKNGADFVVPHNNFVEEFKKIGVKGADYALSCDTPSAFNHIAEVMNPFGHIVFIAAGDNNTVDISKLFSRRISLHWEFMFARPMFNVQPEKQGRLLAQVAELVDKGVLYHNMTRVFPFTLGGVKEALQLQQSGKAIGKLALSRQ